MRPTHRFTAWILLTVLAPLLSMSIHAQEDAWELQNSGVVSSLRGICAVSETCCWASGAAGTVVRTIDAGKSWQSVGPTDATTADFRDIEAWDESTAVIMSAGEVDRLYRTEDGGESWKIVYEHPNPAAFFDGLSFERSGQSGWLMGDPIAGRLFLATTDDWGRTWHSLPKETLPIVDDGIAAFAASGTHLLCPDKNILLIGLGGTGPKSTADTEASLLKTSNAGSEWQKVTVPIRTGQSAGVFSMAAIPSIPNRFILVGGNYLKPEQDTDNVAISDDAGGSWRSPKYSRPKGFRSAVVSAADGANTLLLATGPSGTDQSIDGGESWTMVSSKGFHTMSFMSPTIGWAAGSDGRIARWRAIK